MTHHHSIRAECIPMRSPLDTVLLSVASTVSCTAAVHVYAALSVT